MPPALRRGEGVKLRQAERQPLSVDVGDEGARRLVVDSVSIDRRLLFCTSRLLFCMSRLLRCTSRLLSHVL
jgi:hypothetical protein